MHSYISYVNMFAKKMHCTLINIVLIQLLYLTFAKENYQMRVMGGHYCEPSKRKYAIALTSYFGMPICSASLISSRWVLTAAHCHLTCTWYYASPAYIRDKYLDWDGWLYWSCPVTYIESIHTHPNYDGTIVVNDIALMKLSSPIYNGSRVDYISLPLPHQENITDSCEIATAVGFGRTSNRDDDNVALRVQCLDVAILPQKPCRKKLPSHTSVELNSKICIVATKSKDVCSGDSGGPLICDDIEIGIASYLGGEECASGLPSVFTRVDRYLDFIQDTMNYGIRIFLSKSLYVLSVIIAILNC